MKTLLAFLLISGLLIGGRCPTVLGQATAKLLFGGVHLNYGVGQYKPLPYGIGISGRFQYPVTRSISLTAKVGFESYRIHYTALNPYAYLGYGYNPISGFGFNTMYLSYAMNNYRATGLNVPLALGPRVYLTDRVHADLLGGVDVGANEHMRSAVHLEAGAGYILPLKSGGFLDVNVGFLTSVIKGSNMLTAGVAYGIKIH